MSKPREFWTDGWSLLVRDEADAKELSEHWREVIHVIEHSAYRALEAERDFALQQYKMGCEILESARNKYETGLLLVAKERDQLRAELARAKAYPTEDAYLAACAALEKHRSENEKFRRALEFALKGLSMWRKFQSPGNIAEVEQAISEALGGSDE